MSDGHFNRTLLRQSDYQSALNVGKAMARQTCEKALQETLDTLLGDNMELKEHILRTYKEKLRTNI